MQHRSHMLAVLSLCFLSLSILHSQQSVPDELIRLQREVDVLRTDVTNQSHELEEYRGFWQRVWPRTMWILGIGAGVLGLATILGLYQGNRLVGRLSDQVKSANESLLGQTKSRELEVILPIINRYLDKPRFLGLRRFVHLRWDKVSELAATGQGDTDTRWRQAIQAANEESASKAGKEKVEKDDIEDLVNSLNHVCFLLESHSLESLDFAFSDPILGMWKKLEPFVLDERERRRQGSKSHASFFGAHFEGLANEFKSLEFRSKLKEEASKRNVHWVDDP